MYINRARFKKREVIRILRHILAKLIRNCDESYT